MFTFGRDHEVKHILREIGSEEKARLLLSVVNAVHDLLEGNTNLAFVESTIKCAFVEGKSGIWERTGGWLLKVNGDFPSSSDIWRQLAFHEKATVRFRVASFLTDFPRALGAELYEVLRADKSKKVREHAEGKWDYRQHPEKYA